MAAVAPLYGPLIDALRGVAWLALRPAPGEGSGVHRSRRAGASPEFTEYRPYRQGDDPRRLDWKLLARTDRAYQRVTSAHATLATVIVVDASASMAYPGGEHSKWLFARRLAVGLAAVARSHGDPAGLIVPAAGGVRVAAPSTRSGVLGQMARLLDGMLPAGSPTLADVVREASGQRLVVLSDFLGDSDALLAAARIRLARGDEVYAAHLVAPEELDPPRGATLAYDPEEPLVRRPLVPEGRARYDAAFATWRAALATDWQAAGARYALLDSAEPAQRAVRRIVALASAGAGAR